MRNINLWVTDGYISIPDGNSIYIWGYTDAAGKRAQVPGPRIVVNQGDVVNISITNTLPEATSVVFPGQSGVTADTGSGPQPAGPKYDGGGNLVSLTDFADYPGNPGGNPPTITYTFTAHRPGTFIYESGTNPHKQVQMGLYGAIIVRPSDYDPAVPAKKTAYGENTHTEFDREYLVVVSEIDPVLHQAVEQGKDYKIRDFLPRYWTMNGRSAPDTMNSDNAGYMPNQPYGAMIMAEPDEKVLIRYAGGGIENHPLHPHGNHTRIVALDGSLLKNGTEDLSYKKFTVLVGAGQTYDQVFTWSGLGYNPSNPIPTVMPNLRNLGVGDAGWTMWSGSPYLGEKGDVPVGVTSFNQVGEYHFMVHSHEEMQITNWGEFPGGMMTMIAIFPTGTLGDAGTIEGLG
ncbi:MAG: copper oxidase [Firmicutes bacterium HGW-Firmicutes-14]|nr:MAG: copper oxidase [Firmicutes bacterium HGW-Firmicutes-14]